MNEPTGSFQENLSFEAANRIDQVCDRFEAAWKEALAVGGEGPKLDDYLGDSTETERAALRRELVALDKEYRPRQGETQAWEHHDTFPTAANSSAGEGEGESLAAVPLMVGRFHILGPIGRGGMADVHEGRDSTLDREVAVKVLREDYLGNPELVRRFQEEVKITGRLQHPGIAPVYEMAQFPDGRPCFAMKRVQGVTLENMLQKRTTTDLPRFLTIFEKICQTVAYAHSRGILHRDLKPHNIMVGEFGEVQVMDWGLAKVLGPQRSTKPDLLGSSSVHSGPSQANDNDRERGDFETREGHIVGTPAYMSPEQAAGRIDELAPATDIYSLGATLYTILTGTAPFTGRDTGEVLEKVKKGDWRPPRQVRKSTPLALNAICRKAMALKPSNRYTSAQELAADVQAWLADEAVKAWREPWSVRWGRWLRRHRTLVTASVAVLLVAMTALGIGVVLLTASSTREHNLRILAEDNEKDAIAKGEEADRQRDEARFNQYISQMNLVQREYEMNDIAHVRELLDAQIPTEGSTKDFRHFEWYYWHTLAHRERLTLNGHTTWVSSVAWSRDGQRIASGNSDNTVKVWDARTGQETLTLKGHTAPVLSVAWSGDDQRIVSGSSDGTVKVWDARTGEETTTLKGHTAPVHSVAWSGDGQRIASGSSDGTVKVWDARTGQETLTLGHTGSVSSVAWSGDGQRIASGGDSTVKVWDARTGQETLTLKENTGGVYSVAWSGDGQRIVSGSSDGTVKVWDARTVQEPLTLKGHTAVVRSVAWSGADQRIVSGSSDGTVKVWDARAREETLTFKGHTGLVWSVAWSADGQSIASGGGPTQLALVANQPDCTVKVWDARTGQETRSLKGHTDQVLSVAWSEDGQRIASGSDKTVRVWDARTGQELLTLKGHTGGVYSVAWSGDGERIASGSWDKTVRVWDARTGQETRTLTGHTDRVTSVAWSEDDQHIASGSWDKTVKVWDARTDQETLTLKGHTHRVTSVAWSGDGQRIASASDDKTVKIWDARSGQETHTLKGHKHYVTSVAWSADSQRIASGSWDNTVKVWDARTGQETLSLKGHTAQVFSVAWSGGGQRIASGSADQRVKVWETAAVSEEVLHQRDEVLRARDEVMRARDRAPVFKGVVEAELLPVAESKRCRPSVQDMSPWSRDKWSNGYQVFCSAEKGGYVAFELEVPRAGRYQLAIHFTKAPDYGIVDVSLGGNKIGEAFDGYDVKVIPSGEVAFGIVELSEGKHQIRFTAVDKNPESSDYSMGIDCLKLEPVK